MLAHAGIICTISQDLVAPLLATHSAAHVEVKRVTDSNTLHRASVWLLHLSYAGVGCISCASSEARVATILNSEWAVFWPHDDADVAPGAARVDTPRGDSPRDGPPAPLVHSLQHSLRHGG